MVRMVSRNRNGCSTHTDELRDYTGTLLEDEFVPMCRNPALWERTDYKGYTDSAVIAIENQPREESNPMDSEGRGWNPLEPNENKFPYGSKLFKHVNEKLDKNRGSKLAFFTARGTSYDRFHGVDAFFIYGDGMCTIDFTLDRHKIEYKADVTMQIKYGSDEEFQLYADDIADILGYPSGKLQKIRSAYMQLHAAA